MALTKHSLKKQMMEKTMNNASGENRKKEQPKEILPFFNIDFGEKMEVIFIPYEDGDLFKHFKKHGPNMGIASVGSIECAYHARGESCPACAEGFSHVKDGKATDMSKKWMPKDYYVAQVVVVDTPVEIPQLDDGNQVRVFYMPYAVMEKIMESYQEGIVEDPTEHIFCIKKSKNQGGRPSYANSFFRPQPFGDDVTEAFEDQKLELHDLKELEIEPKEATVDEVEEWVEKARKALENGDSHSEEGSTGSSEKTPEKSSKEDSDNDSGEEEKEEKSSGTSGSSLKERLRKSRASG